MLFFLLAIFSLIATVLSLIFLPFKRFRQRARRVAIVSGATFVVSSAAFFIQADRESDEKAQQQGFVDKAELRDAKEAGITNPTLWREHQRLAQEGKAKEQRAIEEQKRLAEEAKAKERQAQEEQKRRAIIAREALLKAPIEQERFVHAIEKARAAYKSGQTDLQRGAARPTRARDICTALPSPALRQWVGKIARLTTNSSGEGVLAVELAKDVKLITMNNSLSDGIYGTMIKSGSSLYQTLLQMKEGDFVRLEASLFSADSDCYAEISLTMQGSLEKPEFVTNFNRVSRIDLPPQ